MIDDAIKGNKGIKKKEIIIIIIIIIKKIKTKVKKEEGILFGERERARQGEILFLIFLIFASFSDLWKSDRRFSSD